MPIALLLMFLHLLIFVMRSALERQSRFNRVTLKNRDRKIKNYIEKTLNYIEKTLNYIEKTLNYIEKQE